LGSNLIRKSLTRLERLSRDKHASLFGLSVSDEENVLNRRHLIGVWRLGAVVALVQDAVVVHVRIASVAEAVAVGILL
jgi:hypothetical protein